MLNIRSSTLKALWQFRRDLLEWETLLDLRNTLHKVARTRGQAQCTERRALLMCRSWSAGVRPG